ncbi:MAG: NAD(P)/FAD-dependent oxidoreductase [bacterium]|nr:NAD(P)/FAD-dependent oxidoreductase [bacterium]
MDTKLYDSAVIGGGLAGLTLAIQMADAGYSVILFEKEKYPFHKVCGEYISMESFDFLQRLGVPLASMNLPMINEVMISAPNGNTLTRKLDLGGFGVSRFALDSILAALAIKKGVIFLEEARVNAIRFSQNEFTIDTTLQNVRAKLAIGAYGKRSLLDRTLERKKIENPKNFIAVKYHVELDFPDNRIELHNFKDGYCGISKVDGEKYCLCYLTTAQNLRDNENDIKLMEKNVVMKNPFLKKYFTEAEFLCDKPLTISQISFGKKKVIESGVLMLGDAAGTIAPLCGNGMSMAMRSSHEAFQLIENYLKNEISRHELELRYEAQWNRLFSNRIRTGKALQYLFGAEALTNTVIATLKRLPTLADKLISLTHGNKF